MYVCLLMFAGCNRWLRRGFSTFARHPDLMESWTLDDPGSPLMASAKYREAYQRVVVPHGDREWLCTMKFGGPQGWPKDRLILKVAAQI